MLKPNTSPKSPKIELFNDTFAEQKCCQVFAYESETFHRRRSNGISHCENVEQKSPLPLARTGTPFNSAMPDECLTTIGRCAPRATRPNNNALYSKYTS